jgi:hypothetical protein
MLQNANSDSAIENDQPLQGPAHAFYSEEPIQRLLEIAYTDSEKRYAEALTARQQVTTQLAQAQTMLTQAQSQQASPHTGLGAATAAVLAI